MWGNLDERIEVIPHRAALIKCAGENYPLHLVCVDYPTNKEFKNFFVQRFYCYRLGWPFTFRIRLTPEFPSEEIAGYYWDISSFPPTEEPYPFSLAVTANALIAFFVLAFTWFGMEVLLLRLALRKKQPPDPTPAASDHTESKI
ncbi:MAG: hypothetical protein AMXMBFR7_36510 [Planctomycetota bacterium]